MFLFVFLSGAFSWKVKKDPFKQNKKVMASVVQSNLWSSDIKFLGAKNIFASVSSEALYTELCYSVLFLSPELCTTYRSLEKEFLLLVPTKTVPLALAWKPES